MGAALDGQRSAALSPAGRRSLAPAAPPVPPPSPSARCQRPAHARQHAAQRWLPVADEVRCAFGKPQPRAIDQVGAHLGGVVLGIALHEAQHRTGSAAWPVSTRGGSLPLARTDPSTRCVVIESPWVQLPRHGDSIAVKNMSLAHGGGGGASQMQRARVGGPSIKIRTTDDPNRMVGESQSLPRFF